MKTWFRPEIINLRLTKTAGNPATGGNDTAIPDCIEDAFESIYGDHSGPDSSH